MSRETAYVYNLEGERLSRVRGVLMFMGIRVREVKIEEYGRKVGELETAVEYEPWQGERFEEEMMLLSVAPSRVDALLQRFRKHKVPLPTLTAILTATNAQWNSLELSAELRREREAIRQGKAEH